MQKDNAGSFVFDKIVELQSALFFPETPDSRWPACVLQEVKVNDQGQVCFLVAVPSFAIDPDDIGFPCRMEFFKKGTPFYMKVNGIASIATECPTENKNQLMVKVKIQQAFYFEIAPVISSGRVENWKEMIGNAFNKLSSQLFPGPFPLEIKI